ncbi:MAG: M50 family metallopeptidase [Candidatus Micrarchaeia archaeon]|jgi:hypothetical protein
MKLGSSLRRTLTIAIALLAFALLTFLYLASGNALLRWLYAILVLAASGEAIMLVNKLKGSYGAYMLGGKHGIALIDKISKRNRNFWIGLAEWGLALSLGLLSIFLFRYINKKTFALGIATLVLMLYFVLPYTYLSMSFLNIPQITGKLNEAIANSTMNSRPAYYAISLDAATLIGGFATLAVVSIVYNGASIFASTISFIPSLVSGSPNYGKINGQVPGVAPIIPGITMPLLSGILSLAILLIVHEFSHGVLARIAKVKLKSVGVLLFGIVPLGAYVEPEEKKMKRLSKEKQERIFIAGVSSNILVSLIFFAIMIALLPMLNAFMHTYVSVVATIPGYPANNVIAPGSIILKWNGYEIKNLTSFRIAAANDTPFSIVRVQTDKGFYIFKTNQTGKIGVYVQENYLPNGIWGSVLYFFFTLAALSFLLNFLVGVVNLLPIPGFDGWQIYKLELKKGLLNVVGAIVVISLILNILPWLWNV